MLSQPQAEELVLERLNSRFESAQFSIAHNGIAERSFGWVFLIQWLQSRLATRLKRNCLAP